MPKLNMLGRILGLPESLAYVVTREWEFKCDCEESNFEGTAIQKS